MKLNFKVPKMNIQNTNSRPDRKGHQNHGEQ